MSLLAARRHLRTLAIAETEAEANNAAQALVGLPGKWVQRQLERLLRTHESALVRTRAAWTLGFHPQGAEALDALLQTLPDRQEDPDVRAHAAEAAGDMAGQVRDREGDLLSRLP